MSATAGIRPAEDAMALIEDDANPIPPGAESGYISTADGTRLRYAFWPPSGTRRQGTVCLLQGRAEYIEKYFETVRDLTVRGFAVATFDWRGQGGSARRLKDQWRGHVADFDEYEMDLDAFVAQVLLPACPSPYFALAHSTGGLILLRSSTSMRRRFRRSVAMAPLLGFGETGWPPMLAKASARMMRGMGMGSHFIPGGAKHDPNATPFEDNPLTTDLRRFLRNQAFTTAHPEISVGAPTISWVDSAFRAMDAFMDPDRLEDLRMPLLVVAAGDERIVSRHAIERFARSFKGGHLIVIRGARHELLQEADIYREQALAAFDAFVPGS